MSIIAKNERQARKIKETTVISIVNSQLQNWLGKLKKSWDMKGSLS